MVWTPFFSTTAGWKRYPCKCQMAFLHANAHKEWCVPPTPMANKTVQNPLTGHRVCASATSKNGESRIAGSDNPSAVAIRQQSWYKLFVSHTHARTHTLDRHLLQFWFSRMTTVLVECSRIICCLFFLPPVCVPIQTFWFWTHEPIWACCFNYNNHLFPFWLNNTTAVALSEPGLVVFAITSLGYSTFANTNCLTQRCHGGDTEGEIPPVPF